MIQIAKPNSIKRLVKPPADDPFALTIFKNGRFRINHALATEMKLWPGETVSIINKDGYYYLAKDKKGSGWPVSKDKCPSFYSIELMRWIAWELFLPFPGVNSVVIHLAKAPQYINGFHAYQFLTDDK